MEKDRKLRQNIEGIFLGSFPLIKQCNDPVLKM